MNENWNKNKLHEKLPFFFTAQTFHGFFVFFGDGKKKSNLITCFLRFHAHFSPPSFYLVIIYTCIIFLRGSTPSTEQHLILEYFLGFVDGLRALVLLMSFNIVFMHNALNIVKFDNDFF